MGRLKLSLNHMHMFTIGYEKASLGDLLRSLQAAQVTLIADIRERPQSRRAGFSKRMLAATAASSGIDYLHLRALGTPPEGREAHRRRDYAAFWQIFEDQIQTGAAGEALATLGERAAHQVTCLLCYEADWRICHRRRVAASLEQQGFEIHHLTVEPSFL